MVLDVIAAAFLGLALFKGYTRGFIVALCSLLAWVVGLAAALKLSSTVAGYLGQHTGISGKWLPLVSFLLVFVGIMLLVRLLAQAVEKALEAAMLGWANRVVGIALYALLYFTMLSVLLFYGEKMGFLPDHVLDQSVVYPYLAPWGPWVMEMIGTLVPWFSNMFDDLSRFFESLASGQNRPA